MKKTYYFTNIILVCLTIVFTACASGKTAIAQSGYHKVITDKPRKSALGFVVSPPSGSNWFEGLQDKSLVYLKKTGKASYSILTRATELYLHGDGASQQDIMEKTIQQRKQSGLFATAYDNESLHVSSHPLAKNCLRYSFRYEDHAPKNLPVDTVVQVIDNGILCYHPDRPENGIEVSYQEKILAASEKYPSYQNEGESFLRSLRIQPIIN